MNFHPGARVKFAEPSNLRGTVTDDVDQWFPNFVGVCWDGNDFAFVDPHKLVHDEAIPGLAESERAALAATYRASATAAMVEPDPPTGATIEILARFIDEAHLDRIVSTEWRGHWCRPVKLTGYESCRDVHGQVLQQTLRFGDGTQYTTKNPHLKVKVWL